MKTLNITNKTTSNNSLTEVKQQIQQQSKILSTQNPQMNEVQTQIRNQWHTPKKAEPTQSKHTTAATKFIRKSVKRTLRPITFELNLTRFGGKIYLFENNKKQN